MCTSVIAGRNATAGGVIVLARNEDYALNNWNKYMKYRSKPQYAADSGSGDSPENKWILGNGLKVPVPKKSFSYCAMPDAAGSEESAYSVGDHFYYEARGINECNVAISATNSVGINHKAQSADPTVTLGIEEAILLTLILPQSETAAEAVELLGTYVEHYGASEGSGILIGDPGEAWYFEIGSGHHWIAVRVPDNAYVVIANCMRVHEVDLSDTENVKHSKGLFEFVETHKLLENPQRNNFNFAKAFGYPGKMDEPEKDPYYNVDRLWLAQSILTPSKKQKPRQEEYPLFLEPDEKISPEIVMKMLRASYKNTELEGLATRPIGVVRTAESHIITLDPDMPGSLKGCIWQAVSSPLGSPYMPLFLAVTDSIPPAYASGDSNYSGDSAYWAFRSLFALASITENELPIIKDLWRNYESQFLKEHKYIKDLIKTMAETNYEAAVDFAKKYSVGILCQMADSAHRHRNDLITAAAVNQVDDL